jgi:hypothetical protein
MEMLQASIVNQIFGRGIRTQSKEQITQSGAQQSVSIGNGQPKLINRRGVIMVEDQFKASMPGQLNKGSSDKQRIDESKYFGLFVNTKPIDAK